MQHACSRQQGSRPEVQNYSLHPLAVKKQEREVRVSKDDKKVKEYQEETWSYFRF